MPTKGINLDRLDNSPLRTTNEFVLIHESVVGYVYLEGCRVLNTCWQNKKSYTKIRRARVVIFSHVRLIFLTRYCWIVSILVQISTSAKNCHWQHLVTFTELLIAGYNHDNSTNISIYVGKRKAFENKK